MTTVALLQAELAGDNVLVCLGIQGIYLALEFW